MGASTAGTGAFTSGGLNGVYAESTRSGGNGIYAQANTGANAYAVEGVATQGFGGYFSGGAYGAYAFSGVGIGLYGSSASNYGVSGNSSSSSGVAGNGVSGTSGGGAGFAGVSGTDNNVATARAWRATPPETRAFTAAARNTAATLSVRAPTGLYANAKRRFFCSVSTQRACWSGVQGTGYFRRHRADEPPQRATAWKATPTETAPAFTPIAAAAGPGLYATSGAGGTAGVFDGAVTINGIATVHKVQIVGGSDVAEPYRIAASHAVKPIPGYVVAIDPNRVGRMRVANKAYDRTVSGIISGANGVEPGLTLTQKGTIADGSLPVASMGRVWCWCDAGAGGAIAAGDLLTTSATPGHAMKAGDARRERGAILGKAMSSLAHGRGLVLVLVTLQ